MRRPLIAGNWKLQGMRKDLGWVMALESHFPEGPACSVAVCPPATLVSAILEAKPSWLDIGAQDCSAYGSGAHTGEISAAMLAEAGCAFVIVGHSERRTAHAETNAIVKAKAEQVLRAGLTPIICLGESLSERDSGDAVTVCQGQLLASLPDAKASDIVIAYEPIWAIGTGRTATAQQAQEIHHALRKAFPGPDADALRILYGGSVKPDNAAELLSQRDIDGALVGGASLQADSFAAIIDSVE